ncbi:hypothetical protein TI05_08155 [Achromatium sp. WMS3]|nr:hypothetical protein TI05_08155 [Achromatium sp. WMS3]
MNTNIHKYIATFFLLLILTCIYVEVCCASTTTVKVKVDGSGNVLVCNADNYSQCIQQHHEAEAAIVPKRQVLSASCSSVEGFVQQYYADYRNGDVRAVLKKRLKPSKIIAEIVRNTEWCGIPHTKLIKCTENNAIVYVDVTTKNYHRRPKRWLVNVYLQNVHGQWLITSIKSQRK